MSLLEKLMEINEITRKGKVELNREEVLELSDLVRYIPDNNRQEIYDYLIENDPLLGKRIERETINWLADIFQNIGEINGEVLQLRPRHLH